jgi:hypothetical protein
LIAWANVTKRIVRAASRNQPSSTSTASCPDLAMSRKCARVGYWMLPRHIFTADYTGAVALVHTFGRYAGERMLGIGSSLQENPMFC